MLQRAWRIARTEGDLTPRYLATAGLVVGAWLAFYGLVRSGQRLDRWLVPQAQRTPLNEPIFIMANPRSGTTFLHRLMSRDPQFSSLALYETVLPSGLFMRGVRKLARVDHALGRPLGRLVEAFERLAFGGWRGIHRISFSEPEEDEMLFLYALKSPALMLLHPSLGDLPEVTSPDRLPEPERQRLAGGLRSALQRHAWASGGGRRLLAKNALAAGRLKLYQAVAPDLRLVVLHRHPYEAIPSMVSMFSRPWRWFRPQWTRDVAHLRRVARLGCELYRDLDAFADTLPSQQVVRVRYEDLVADPEATVKRIYRAFNLEVTETFATLLAKETERSQSYRSQHTYDLEALGLSKEWIHRELGDQFERHGFAA